MSADKHRGVWRRKFVMANLPLVDWGHRRGFYKWGFMPAPSPVRGGVRRPLLNLTRDVKRLEREGKIVRRRTGPRGFSRHVRNTELHAA